MSAGRKPGPPPHAVRIPTAFLADRFDRSLPCPTTLHDTRSAEWIDPQDPTLPDVVSDAEHYGQQWTDATWLVQPARALLRAIYRARPDLRPADSCVEIEARR